MPPGVERVLQRHGALEGERLDGARQHQVDQHGARFEAALTIAAATFRAHARAHLGRGAELDQVPTSAPCSSIPLSGKEKNKPHLLAMWHLPYRPEVPVFGLVSRLVWQMGLDLCLEVLPEFLHHHRFQLVFLGKGEPRYEERFRLLAQAYPHRVGYSSAFNEQRAHQVEAGADMFLMPSRYEPCGLNQMYSQRYGTVPVVHKTGGLADTVWPFGEKTGNGTDLVFEHFDARGLSWAMRKALEGWGLGTGAHRERWRHIQRNGLDPPFDWKHRVGRSVEIYERLTGAVRGG